MLEIEVKYALDDWSAVRAKLAEWRAERAEDRAEADHYFPPNPSSLCGWCDFARLCPEGRRISPPRQPWSGLDEDDATESYED